MTTRSPVSREPAWVRAILMTIALGFLAIFLVLPLGVVLHAVVSGHIRGETNTVPLHVEILYNDFQYQSAFAVATILIGIALATLVAKSLIEWHAGRNRQLR